MSDGRGLSRRKILAGMAGAGSVGAFAGGMTSAVLSDTEGFFGNTFGAGALDVDLAWIGDSAGATKDNTAGLGFGDIEPCEKQSEVLSVSVPEADDANPAELWLRAGCPSPVDTDVAEQLKVSLYYYDCASQSRGAAIVEDISLLGFANLLADGIQLAVPDGAGPTGSCLAVGGEVCLEFEYQLAKWYEGSESVSMLFEVLAQQCRHNDGLDSPIQAGSTESPCGELDCVCCAEVGKLEATGSYLEAGTVYAFSETEAGYDDYALYVRETIDKSEAGGETVAVKLELRDGDGEPVQLCEVEVAGGPRDKGEEPPGPGSRIYDGDNLESMWLANQAKVEDPPDPSDDPGAYYGISHIVVWGCETSLENCWEDCEDDSKTGDDNDD